MTQTVEDRKIKRLENEVKTLKEKIKELEKIVSWREGQLFSEREWKRDLQRLMKDVVHEDTLDSYPRY